MERDPEGAAMGDPLSTRRDQAALRRSAAFVRGE